MVVAPPQVFTVFLIFIKKIHFFLLIKRKGRTKSIQDFREGHIYPLQLCLHRFQLY